MFIKKECCSFFFFKKKVHRQNIIPALSLFYKWSASSVSDSGLSSVKNNPIPDFPGDSLVSENNRKTKQLNVARPWWHNARGPLLAQQEAPIQEQSECAGRGCPEAAQTFLHVIVRGPVSYASTLSFNTHSLSNLRMWHKHLCWTPEANKMHSSFWGFRLWYRETDIKSSRMCHWVPRGRSYVKDAVAAQVYSPLVSCGVRKSVQCLGRWVGVQCVEWRTRLLNI